MKSKNPTVQKISPALLLVACTSLDCVPENARDLTEEERTAIQETLEEQNEATLDIVKHVLPYADPLFDLHGNPIADNSILYEQLSALPDAFLERVANNHVKIVPESAWEVGYGGKAITTITGEQFIVIPSETELSFTHGIRNLIDEFMHEEAHFIFGPHDLEIVALEDKISGTNPEDIGTLGQLYEELYDLAFEKRDGAFLGGFVMGSVGDLWGAVIEEAAAQRASQIIDSLLNPLSGAAAASVEQNTEIQYTALQEAAGASIEEWAAATTDLMYSYSSPRQLLTTIHVSHDELVEALSTSTIAYEYQQRLAEETLRLFRKEGYELLRDADLIAERKMRLQMR